MQDAQTHQGLGTFPGKRSLSARERGCSRDFITTARACAAQFKTGKKLSEDKSMPTCVLSFLLSCSTLLTVLQDPAQSHTPFSLTEMLKRMSWIGIAVVVVLLLMSIYSIAVMLE